MRHPAGCCFLSVLVMSLAIPALARGAPGEPQEGPDGGWPCRLVIDADLKPFAELAWEHSAMFREQCRTLAAGRATVIVRSASSRETQRAQARIGVSDDGTILAFVRIKPGRRTLEYLAHELEHVIERVEGVNLLMESQRGGTRVGLVGGAFETRRAIEAGLTVAREVRDATKAAAKAR